VCDGCGRRKEEVREISSVFSSCIVGEKTATVIESIGPHAYYY
jgi:hypothetical protein